jgi:hypothetical protein
MEVYLGKQVGQAVDRGKGMAYGVVSRLTQPLRGKGYHIYMDNLFTSVRLMKHLLRKGLYACGTMRDNRKGYPQELKNATRLQHGEAKMKQDGNLVACCWRDKKNVNFLSTNGDPTQQHEVLRRQRDGQRVAINCPDPARKYQKYMGGVDRCDQLRGKYPVARPCKKWWRYLLYFLISTCIVNGHLTMVASNQAPTRKRRYRQIDFRINLAMQLIGDYNGYKRKLQNNRQATGMIPVTAATIAQHEFVSLTDRKKRKYCKNHFLRDHRRKDTVYGCNKCHVHLCSIECHREYHVRLQADVN